MLLLAVCRPRKQAATKTRPTEQAAQLAPLSRLEAAGIVRRCAGIRTEAGRGSCRPPAGPLPEEAAGIVRRCNGIRPEAGRGSYRSPAGTPPEEAAELEKIPPEIFAEVFYAHGLSLVTWYINAPL